MKLPLKSFNRKLLYGQAFWDHRRKLGSTVVERSLMPDTNHIHFQRNVITKF